MDTPTMDTPTMDTPTMDTPQTRYFNPFVLLRRLSKASRRTTVFCAGACAALLALALFFNPAFFTPPYFNPVPSLTSDPSSTYLRVSRAMDDPSTPHLVTDAEYREHVEQLKERLPHDGFHIVVQKPFVVIGDESKQLVQWRAEKTIKWAVDRIKQDYFERDPKQIIDIWLFKDKASYEQHATALFGKKPHTPYGYYSARHKALVMNISTGGGTLVHEIVHPFIESNFPDCPAWFNEGLASLYEQCRDREGHIWGSTNWRLRGLQVALESDAVPSFHDLCHMTSDEFYGGDRGVHYAQARYLCYYLQEQGKLIEYYHKFVKNVDRDPGGYATLQSVLGRSDMEAFQQEWKEFVLNLRFPE